MRKDLKKVIAALTAVVCIQTGCFNPAVYATNGDVQVGDSIQKACSDICLEEDFDTFAQDVSALVAKDENWVIQEGTDEFQTKRLVVKSAGVVTDDTAIDCVSGFDDLYIFQYETIEATKAAYEKFAEMDEVIYVEPDEVVSTVGHAVMNSEDVTSGPAQDIDATSDSVIASGDSVTASGDSAYLSWGIEAMGMDVFASALTGEALTGEVIVAVVDTGLNDDISSIFTDRIVSGAAYAQINPKYTADRRNDVYEDDNGHGTMVTGIIAEATPDNVKFMPVKALDYQGYGTDLTVYMGLMHAIKANVDVINMSLGGVDESRLYEDAMRDAAARNIAVVVAAGNEAQNVMNVSPARIESVFTISAIDSEMNFAEFSNLGNAIDFAAPGVEVEALWYEGGTDVADGTSFSAPHMAAAVALLLCAIPDLEVSEVAHLLKVCSTDLGDAGWDKYYGYGIVDLSDVTKEYLEMVLNPTGDVDENGEVTLDDAQIVLRAALGIEDVSEAAFRKVDMDLDDNISLVDAKRVLEIALGIK